MSLAQTAVTSPIGDLWVVSSDQGLRSLHRDRQELPQADPHGVAAAFSAYVEGDLDALSSLPLDPRGTHFQQAVWQALRAIPAGTTTTYGALAARLGKPPGASRAVGAAVGANPLGIVIPCHRVLGHDGSLTGFAWGLEAKRTLLAHEGCLPAEQQALF